MPTLPPLPSAAQSLAAQGATESLVRGPRRIAESRVATGAIAPIVFPGISRAMTLARPAKRAFRCLFRRIPLQFALSLAVATALLATTLLASLTRPVPLLSLAPTNAVPPHDSRRYNTLFAHPDVLIHRTMARQHGSTRPYIGTVSVAQRVLPDGIVHSRLISQRYIAGPFSDGLPEHWHSIHSQAILRRRDVEGRHARPADHARDYVSTTLCHWQSFRY